MQFSGEIYCRSTQRLTHLFKITRKVFFVTINHSINKCGYPSYDAANC